MNNLIVLSAAYDNVCEVEGRFLKDDYFNLLGHVSPKLLAIQLLMLYVILRCTF